jgi:hypothetical protein
MGNPDDERLTRAQHAFLIGAVVLCRVLAVRCCPTYDDAFITYRYAQNLADGAGLVYNPGAAWEPVLGTTTPFYALLLSAFARFGADLVVASLALNILFDAITALLLPRMLGFARARSAVALLAFAALPQIVRISVGGMESPLFVLCGVGAAVALTSQRAALAGLLAALACVVRPEGVLLCAVLFLSRVRRPRELVRFAVPVLAVGVVSVLCLSLAYGSPIPQSVLAKSTMHGGDALGESLRRWKTIVQQSFAPSWWLVPLLPFVLSGAVTSLARAGALRLFSLWALAITASYLVARPHTWGWYYYVPLVAWTLWLGVGAARAREWIAPRIGERLARAADAIGPQVAATCAVALAALACWKLPTPVDPKVYEPMRVWAESVSREHPHASILASDIGAIGWYWSGTVLDSEGLVWPDALRYKQPNAIIEALKPDYVMLVAERPRLQHFQERADLYARYVPIARFSVKGLTKIDPSYAELTPDWTQDYLVYARREP